MIDTPFEQTGIKTTWAAESAFIDAVEAASPRVRVLTAGTTVGGRPIRLVGIGHPSPPPDPGTVESPCMVAIGYQHGHEAAGREGALALIRDLAFTTDPVDVDYLNRRTVWVIPSVNADRIEDGIKENLNGQDLNRDHVALSQPETRAIHATIRDLRPHIVVDMHEGAASSLDSAIGVTDTPQGDAQLHDLSWASQAAFLSIQYGAGQLVGEWPYDRGEDMMRNAGGLRHTLPFLIETNMTGNQELPRRIAAHVAANRAIRSFHNSNAGAIGDAIRAARVRKAREGKRGTVPFSLTSGTTLDPPPLAYRLNPAQYALAQDAITADGIVAVQDGADWITPMGQALQPVIPFLVDPQSPYRVVDGQRVSDPALVPDLPPPVYLPAFEPTSVPPPAGDARSFGPIRVGGVDCRVTAVEVMAAGVAHRVWEPSD